jgi:hypothetical protein
VDTIVRIPPAALIIIPAGGYVLESKASALGLRFQGVDKAGEI